MPLLALFDVDGTPFPTHDPLSGEALRDALAVQSPRNKGSLTGADAVCGDLDSVRTALLAWAG